MKRSMVRHQFKRTRASKNISWMSIAFLLSCLLLISCGGGGGGGDSAPSPTPPNPTPTITGEYRGNWADVNDPPNTGNWSMTFTQKESSFSGNITIPNQGIYSYTGSITGKVAEFKSYFGSDSAAGSATINGNNISGTCVSSNGHRFTYTGIINSGSPPQPTSSTIASKEIGNQGGTIEITNQNSVYSGLKVDIPPGALSTNTNIVISIADSPLSDPPSGHHRIGAPIVFGPSGTIFNVPIKVTIPFMRPLSVDEIGIVPIYDENNQNWEISAFYSFDLDKGLVTVLVNHFSILDRLITTIVDAIQDLKTNDIKTTPEFGIDRDVFPVINFSPPFPPSTDDTGYCWGITTYSKWFFESKRQERKLKTAYSVDTAVKIGMDAQSRWRDKFVGLYNELMDMYNSVSNKYLPYRDMWTLGYLKAGLAINKTPQLLGLENNAGERHAVLVHKMYYYPTSPNEFMFAVYDPNDNTIWRTLTFDKQMMAFLYPYNNYNKFIYLGFYLKSNGMKDIYDKYPYDGNEGFTLKYSQDFSADPGWTTNNLTRFYRDAATNTLYAKTVESANEYATTQVNWAGNSFSLEFDIKISSSVSASGISVGLFDADRNDSLPNVVDVIYGNSSSGLHVNVHAANSSTNKWAPSGTQPITTNVWYHNVLSWDKATGIVSLMLTKRDDGSLVGNYSIDGFYQFPTDMTNLGVSWVGHTLSPMSTTSYLDNFQFYEKQ